MTPSDDFDYEQEERDIGAAFRALLPPPPVPATPDELDAAFFAAIRTFPVGSVAPHPPDIASRLVPIARRAVARARRRTFLRRVAVCFLAAVFLVGCAVFSPLWRKLVFREVSGRHSSHPRRILAAVQACYRLFCLEQDIPAGTLGRDPVSGGQAL